MDTFSNHMNRIKKIKECIHMSNIYLVKYGYIIL